MCIILHSISLRFVPKKQRQKVPEFKDDILCDTSHEIKNGILCVLSLLSKITMGTATCESCLMPLSKDLGKRESEHYCSYCFQNGAFTYAGNDVKEFQKKSYEAMRAHGINPLLARFYTFMIRFAPRWKEGSGQ